VTRKLRHHQYERLKSLAADLIEDYGLSYPLQPFAIAELLGVQVTIHPLGLPLTARLCDTDDGYTEAVTSDYGTKFQIHLSGTKPPLRQRFTVMHEIAHIWGDHLRPGRSIERETAEAEANFLAGYLLAPDALITAWVPELDIATIAAVFQMSEEAAGIAHGRVVRAHTRNALGRSHDLRIVASARRGVQTGFLSPGTLWESA